MNSGTKMKRSLLWLGLGGLLLMSACADRGPTNLYSQPLFGQPQSGAKMEVWRVTQDSLSPTAGLDGFVVWIKNTGGGSTVGPITATLIPLSGCASTVNYGTTAAATAVFGAAGDVINPGDLLRGRAVDQNGTVQNSQYAYEASFNLTQCAGATINFNVNAADNRGGSWSSSFSALAQ